ncbi:MAG: class I SAM-dependent methyltransferase [Kiritimatiellales bacterium]
MAGSGRWVRSAHVAQSYDRLASDYEQNWLNRLSPITDRFLDRIPSTQMRHILDLGCGTGHSIQYLVQKYPTANIHAQDISQKMINIAKGRLPSVQFTCSDMLNFMKGQPPKSANLIVSAWSIGYSHPRRILREAVRVLTDKGYFAFIVNLADTLRPIYIAFRKTMQEHPDKLKALALPHFPSSLKQLLRPTRAHSLGLLWSEQEKIQIGHTNDISLDWLLRTGILAGFDSMLPLAANSDIAASFTRFIHEQNSPIEHHYIAAILQKQ